jgi:hypothetical protein
MQMQMQMQIQAAQAQPPSARVHGSRAVDIPLSPLAFGIWDNMQIMNFPWHRAYIQGDFRLQRRQRGAFWFYKQYANVRVHSALRAARAARTCT